MPDIEIPLTVRTDAHGDEFYVGKPEVPATVDLSKATFLVFHPTEDDNTATMIVKVKGRRERKKATLPDDVIEDLFLKELVRAERNFEDKGSGYVGLGYFLHVWKPRSRAFPRSPTERQKVLDRMAEKGLIELYQTKTDGEEDLKDAIRTLV